MALTSLTKDFVVRAGLVVEGTAAVTTASVSNNVNKGALQVYSGIATPQNLMIGSTASVWGPTNLYNTLNVSGNALLNANALVGNLFTATGAAYFACTVVANGNGTFNNNLLVNNLFTSTGAAYFGGTVETNGVLTIDNSTTAAGGCSPAGALVVANGGIFVDQNVVVAGTGNVTGSSNTSTAAVSIQAGGLYVNGGALIDVNTAATSAGAGALIVANGGAYIKKNLYVSGTCASTSNTASNSLYTAGGAGIAKCLAVGGNAVIAGDLTVLGVQTVINSTATYIQDPVFSIGGGACGANLTTDDGMNRGLLINYYSGSTNSHMFLGRNDSTGNLVLRTNIDPGTSEPIPNADLVGNGAYATMDLGSLISHDTTALSSGTQSGALQVAGGAYIGGSLQVAGTIWGTVDKANNLTGGSSTSVGQVPYQTGVGVTAYSSSATTDNQLLTWCGTNNKAIWKLSSASKFACYSGTATNIAGGAQFKIPFQSGTSATTFSSSFKFHSDFNYLQVGNAYIYGCGSCSPIPGAGAVLYACGEAAVFSSGGSAQLNYDNSSKVTVNNYGATLETPGGTAVFDTCGALTLNNGGLVLTSGNVTLNGGAAYVKASAVKVTGLGYTSGGVVYAGACGNLQSDSGMSYNGSGHLTLSTELQVTGSGGNITMSCGAITGVTNICSNGTITAGTFHSGNLTTGRLLYSNNGDIAATCSGISVSGGTLRACGVDVTGLSCKTGGIVYAGACGALTNSSSFKICGTTLSASNVCASSGNVVAGTFKSSGLNTGGILYSLAAGDGTIYNDSSITVCSGSLSAACLTASGLGCVAGGIVYAGTGGKLTDASGFTFNGTTLTTPKAGVSNCTAATTSGAGALAVTGGAYVGANVVVNSVTAASGSTAGAVYTAGGVNVAKNVLVQCTTTAGSCGSGAIATQGGVYVAKNVYIGGTGSSTADYCGSGALAVAGGIAVCQNIAVNSSAPTLGGTHTLPSFGTQGGAYIKKDLYVGTTSTFGGDVFIDGTLYVQGQSLTGVDKISGSTGTFQDLVSTGTIFANAITATSLTVTGPVNLAQLVLTNATLTNLTVTNAARLNGITTASVFNATTATITGLTVTGNSYLAGTTATSLNVTGNSTLNTVTVTGDSYLAGTTATSLNVTGDSYLAGTTATSLNVTGNSTLNNLTVTGGTTLAHVTATSASLTGDLFISSTDGAQFMNAVGHIASSVIGQGYSTACAASIVTEGGIRAGKDIVIGGAVVAGDARNNIGHTGTNGIFIVNNVQAAIGQSGISGSSSVIIDTFSTDYASAKYLVQLVDGSNIHTEEILLIQDGTNVYMNQFSVVTNNGELGIFDADISGNVVQLTFQPNGATSLTVQVVRQSILSAIPTY